MSAPTKTRKVTRGRTRGGRITPKNSMTSLTRAIEYAGEYGKSEFTRGVAEGGRNALGAMRAVMLMQELWWGNAEASLVGWWAK